MKEGTGRMPASRTPLSRRAETTFARPWMPVAAILFFTGLVVAVRYRVVSRYLLGH